MKSIVNRQSDSRRKFLEQMALLGLGFPIIPGLMNSGLHSAGKTVTQAKIDSISVFSKPLQFLSSEDAAKLASEIGFDGIDYTVRPQGHILPEKVKTDLPKAVEAAKVAGITASTMTTAITSVKDPYAEDILSTASKTGIRYYRLGWLEYDHRKSLIDNLEGLIPQFRELAEMNKKYNITGDYQNHAGVFVGSPVWDLYQVFNTLDPAWIGSQYDIRHATCEGADCWPLGFELLYPYFHTLVIKDFYWRKIDGKWQPYDTPLGDGMVDFPSYFKLIKKFGIRGTITVHFEYPLTEQPDSMLPVGETMNQVKAKMKKDLATLRNFIAEAGIEYK